jgi:hypothetical protein
MLQLDSFEIVKLGRPRHQRGRSWQAVAARGGSGGRRPANRCDFIFLLKVAGCL